MNTRGRLSDTKHLDPSFPRRAELAFVGATLVVGLEQAQTGKETCRVAPPGLQTSLLAGFHL